ncbi:putative plant non-specific lipid-transfer protein/Par allergen [Helianthus annuus]|nr:putative plant non-specific lipid-transfer protein/Par allergen [Helianthus annuus]KAJ0691544.1 putative plant non-specific lipid-transfer protein/Par allergen [Helianthus annuus]
MVSSITFPHIKNKHIRNHTSCFTMMMKVLCIMIICMVVVAPYAAALTCGDVNSKLIPCLNYLKHGGKVPVPCCKGVKGLNAAAKTTAEKKTACSCMKKAYKRLSGIKEDNAVALPKKCGVSIPYKISPHTDCNKYVKFLHYCAFLSLNT